MSYGYQSDAKERIRDAIDIVDLVGRYVELRRSGRNMVGRCPWHDDTRPSLQVNPDRQSFKCWVCDIGGDIFSFVMKMEGVEFREALTMLAEQAGVELTPYKPSGPITGDAPRGGGSPFESTTSAPSSQDRKQALYRAMAWAEQQYHDCLLSSPEAESARKYLSGRGITQESIKKFRIGFSPNEQDWMVRLVGRNPQRMNVLEAIGVLTRSAHGGSLYDRFRGRVLFPIRDVQDRPVGIGGRVLPEMAETTRAKYLNSPETPLFAKSKLLYGLDLARETIRKQKLALVMEGYTDVIVAHQYGFTNAIAVLGTALGEQHVRMFKNFGAKVVLVLDGDEAGRRRTAELLGLFLSKNVDMHTLTLPAGSDPCDYLQANGAEGLQSLLDTETIDVFEHVYRVHTEGVDIDRDLHGANEALEGILREIAKAPRLSIDTSGEQRLREQMLLQRISARFRMEEREIRSRLASLRRAEQSKPAPRASVEDRPPVQGERRLIDEEMPIYEDSEETYLDEPVSAYSDRPIDSCEREMMQMVLRYPEATSAVAEAIDRSRVEHPTARWFYDTCSNWVATGQDVSFDRLMLATEESAVKNLLVNLDEDITSRADKIMVGLEDWLAQIVRGFQNRDMARRRRVDPASLSDASLDQAKRTSLLEDILRQQRARHGISEPKEG